MIFTFDFETTLISAQSPVPKPVVLAYQFGDAPVEVTTDFYGVLSQGLECEEIVAANSKFDMTVILEWIPELSEQVWRAYKEKRVRDILIKAKLRHLEKYGKVEPMSLAKVAKQALGVDISEEKEDENSWRYRYAELLGTKIDSWPKEAIEYPKQDVALTRQCYDLLNKHPQPTEQLQTYSDFCLYLSTVKGVKINTEFAKQLQEELQQSYDEARLQLIELGFAREHPKTGKVTIEQKKLKEYVLDKYFDQIEYTDKGNPKLDKEALQALPEDPILDIYRAFKENATMVQTFMPKLIDNEILHPSYDILKETGRTSCYGSSALPGVNIQQIPNRKGLRECFVARPGHKLISVDYSSLELMSAANQLYKIYGYSKLRDAINEGRDVHSWLGAQLYSIEYGATNYDNFMKLIKIGDKDAKSMRQKAKAITLGTPGGMSANTIVNYAKAMGIHICKQEAHQIRELFLDTYPEFRQFFDDVRNKFNTGVDVAYSSHGRIRNKCSYTQYCNGLLLQSPSADGAKLAIIAATEYFGPIWAFIHDQIIVEVPEKRAKEDLEILSEIMVDAMQDVFDEIRISTEGEIMSYWSKDGSTHEYTFTFSKPPKKEQYERGRKKSTRKVQKSSR